MTAKVAFILGIGRSGSTMVDLMLGSHSQGFSLGEVSKIPEIFRRHRTAAAFCPDSGFWSERFTPEEAHRLAVGLSGHRIHQSVPLALERTLREWLGRDAILNPYTLLADKIQQPLLVDSSKYPDWVARRLTAREFRRGPLQPYLLHVVRDGRAVLNSYLRAFPQLTVDGFAQRWLDNLHHCQQVYADFPMDRKQQVRYEALATDPQATMAAVCQQLQIPFEPTMVEYWRQRHHYVAGSLSTRAMIARYHDQPVNDLTRTIHGNHYQTIDLAIKLDQRWRQELDADKLARFYQLIGDCNRPFEWND